MRDSKSELRYSKISSKFDIYCNRVKRKREKSPSLQQQAERIYISEFLLRIFLLQVLYHVYNLPNILNIHRRIHFT